MGWLFEGTVQLLLLSRGIAARFSGANDCDKYGLVSPAKSVQEIDPVLTFLPYKGKPDAVQTIDIRLADLKLPDTLYCVQTTANTEPGKANGWTCVTDPTQWPNCVKSHCLYDQHGPHLIRKCGELVETTNLIAKGCDNDRFTSPTFNPGDRSSLVYYLYGDETPKSIDATTAVSSSLHDLQNLHCVLGPRHDQRNSEPHEYFVCIADPTVWEHCFSHYCRLSVATVDEGFPSTFRYFSPVCGQVKPTPMPEQCMGGRYLLHESVPPVNDKSFYYFKEDSARAYGMTSSNALTGALFCLLGPPPNLRNPSDGDKTHWICSSSDVFWDECVPGICTLRHENRQVISDCYGTLPFGSQQSSLDRPVLANQLNEGCEYRVPAYDIPDMESFFYVNPSDKHDSWVREVTFNTYSEGFLQSLICVIGRGPDEWPGHRGTWFCSLDPQIFPLCVTRFCSFISYKDSTSVIGGRLRVDCNNDMSLLRNTGPDCYGGRFRQPPSGEEILLKLEYFYIGEDEKHVTLDAVKDKDKLPPFLFCIKEVPLDKGVEESPPVWGCVYDADRDWKPCIESHCTFEPGDGTFIATCGRPIDRTNQVPANCAMHDSFLIPTSGFPARLSFSYYSILENNQKVTVDPQNTAHLSLYCVISVERDWLPYTSRRQWYCTTTKDAWLTSSKFMCIKTVCMIVTWRRPNNDVTFRPVCNIIL